jgi:hypothetical protein
MDVGFFAQLKTGYSKDVDKWIARNRTRKLSTCHIPEIIKDTYNKSASLSSAEATFRKSGIWSTRKVPHGPDLESFTNEEFSPSEIFPPEIPEEILLQHVDEIIEMVVLNPNLKDPGHCPGESVENIEFHQYEFGGENQSQHAFPDIDPNVTFSLVLQSELSEDMESDFVHSLGSNPSFPTTEDMESATESVESVEEFERFELVYLDQELTPSQSWPVNHTTVTEPLLIDITNQPSQPFLISPMDIQSSHSGSSFTGTRARRARKKGASTILTSPENLEQLKGRHDKKCPNSSNPRNRCPKIHQRRNHDVKRDVFFNFISSVSPIV